MAIGLDGGAPFSRRPIRVLIVDDSAIVRRVLSEALSVERGIEVVGTAPDPYVARDKILELKPDVLTLDIEMPRMDGISFLKRLMRYRPMPVIVISSLGQSGCEAAFAAMRLGALEVVAKPSGPFSVGELKRELAAKIRGAALARLDRLSPPTAEVAESGHRGGVHFASWHAAPAPRRHLVAIGSSTGGTQAIERILGRFPADCPPIVIVQHIPPVFSRTFAERLNSVLPMEVKEASDGDEIRSGRVLIAPGNFHLLVSGTPGTYQAVVRDGPLVCYQRPSVEVLFRSVAQHCGRDSVAVMLTGMGNDGAQAMRRIRDRGGWTIAQDEASCVVYGMPHEAVQAGAVEQTVSLERIPEAIEQALMREPATVAPENVKS